MRRTILLVLVLLVAAASKSSAVLDSMYANSALLTSVGNATYATGKPDGQQTIIPPTGELFLQFLRGDNALEFAAGSYFHLYWKKESNDSTAAVIYMAQMSASGFEISRDSVGIIDQPGMVTIPVTKSGYNALIFTLTSHPPANDGSQVFYVDAVTLIQDNLGVASGRVHNAVFSLYPNPSLMQSGFSLSVPEEYVGHSQVVIYNMLGNTAATLSVDQAQLHSVMENRGTYVARLIVDGIPLGDAYKFTVE